MHGLQQSEVAIGKLDQCIFAVFSLYIDNFLIIEPDDISTILGGTHVSLKIFGKNEKRAHSGQPLGYSLPDRMYVIPWGFDYLRLSLGDEQVLEVRQSLGLMTRSNLI
jgi:hypothetical protein